MAQPDQQSLIFSRLLIEGWRQFDTVDIELHPRLTVLTGANGSGKTTLLGLFAKHFGWRGMYLGTPISNKEGGFSFVVGWVKRLLGRGATPDSHVRIGSLTYSNNVTAAILVPKDAGVQYVVDFNPQHLVSGVQISSNRYMPSYRQVGSIPAIAMLPEMAYQNYFGELVTQNQGGSTGYSPIYRMKEALISMATFGAGNLYVQRNQAVLDSFLGFSEVLKKILPKSLGFLELSIRTPDVVLVTETGEFLIDASSGGIMTLVDIAWQIFLYSLRGGRFVVAFDEPENHLHPSMQRSIVPDLLRAFPQAQSIVATHSPFVVSSVKDSNVYVLAYREGEDVESQRRSNISSIKLDTANKAGSAAEILRDVLGVRVTIPEWVEENLAQIVQRYRGKPITEEMLSDLRRELAQLGYGELNPEALRDVIFGLFTRPLIGHAFIRSAGNGTKISFPDSPDNQVS